MYIFVTDEPRKITEDEEIQSFGRSLKAESTSHGYDEAGCGIKVGYTFKTEIYIYIFTRKMNNI